MAQTEALIALFAQDCVVINIITLGQSSVRDKDFSHYVMVFLSTPRACRLEAEMEGY